MKSILLLCFAVVLFTQCKSTKQTSIATATLDNTYWKLSEMNGMPVITPADAREVHIILSKVDGNNQLKGFAGCNTVAGSFKTEGSALSFTAITTRMFCQDRMEVENFLTTTLSETDSYKIEGTVLELYKGNTFLAKFEAVYLK